MNKGHTPGPWQWDHYDSQLLVSKEGYSIAKVYLNDTKPTTPANARLIAAAPELLEQLKALVVQIEASNWLIVPPGVREAIAKAERP